MWLRAALTGERAVPAPERRARPSVSGARLVSEMRRARLLHRYGTIEQCVLVGDKVIDDASFDFSSKIASVSRMPLTGTEA